MYLILYREDRTIPTQPEFIFEPSQGPASKEELREALYQEAKAAHDHSIQTGLHLTAEEVNAWIDELEAGNNVALPKCHT